MRVIIDHMTMASACVGAAFVVADQAAGAHKPGESAFDDPAAGQRLEAAGRRRCV